MPAKRHGGNNLETQSRWLRFYQKQGHQSNPLKNKKKAKGFAKVGPVYLSRTGKNKGVLCFNRGSSIICSQTQLLHIGGTFVLWRFWNMKCKMPSQNWFYLSHYMAPAKFDLHDWCLSDSPFFRFMDDLSKWVPTPLEIKMFFVLSFLWSPLMNSVAFN